MAGVSANGGAGGIMAQQDFVIRIAGEAGEGIQSTGQLLAQAAARSGFRVLTDFLPPAEIKGGHSVYQVRLSNGRIYSRGDDVDILLAETQEAYDLNIQDLKPGGRLIYDPAEVAPPEGGTFQQVAFPLTEISKVQLRFDRGKNVVAFAAAATLFGLAGEQLNKLVVDRFGKYQALLPSNLAAVEAGRRYVLENIPDREQYQLTAPQPAENIMVVSGNQALSIGAVAAGCRFFAGYPITPASDIMEFLAEALPRVGGAVIQAEDEISAITMCIGASYAGKKAMTSTSGPGFSLMVEALGLATMAEIPVVVVDAQRAGPSTGMPTRHEQGDLYLAAFGGHGEVPRIVLAPTSVADCFYQIINAFNLAEKYQTPVIVLSDTVLAVRTESIEKPDLNEVHIEHRLLYQPNGRANGAAAEGDRYLRYALTESGISPMSLPGMEGGQYVAMGLEHNEIGRPRYDVRTHASMTEKRFRKIMAARHDAPEPERYGDPGAEIGILTWGSTAGAVIEAIDLLRSRGINADLLAPKMLRPLPDHQIEPWLVSKRIVIVPEVNYSGQFADLVVARYAREVVRITTYGGVPFRVRELAHRIAQAVEQTAPVQAGVVR
jgi:2-oxoglutarate ferredoxin oxidoreductase subunit alpha